MYSVQISEKAESEIWEHVGFLAKVSFAAADKLLDTIYFRIFELEKNASAHPIFYKNFRKMTVGDRYAVFYAIIGDVIHIDRVYDMRTSEYNNIILEKEMNI